MFVCFFTHHLRCATSSTSSREENIKSPSTFCDGDGIIFCAGSAPFIPPAPSRFLPESCHLETSSRVPKHCQGDWKEVEGIWQARMGEKQISDSWRVFNADDRCQDVG
jgi:hypothetical protein